MTDNENVAELMLKKKKPNKPPKTSFRKILLSHRCGVYHHKFIN